MAARWSEAISSLDNDVPGTSSVGDSPNDSPSGNDVGHLFEVHSREIERFFLSRTHGDLPLSQDLTSLVFTRAAAAIASFRPESPRGWLYQIARNVLIDHLRKNRPTHSLDQTDTTIAADAGPEELAMTEEVQAQIHAALDDLSEPQRSIMILRLRGHTGPEIATHLGLTHDAVRSAQYRAMANLRRALAHLRQRDDL